MPPDPVKINGASIDGIWGLFYAVYDFRTDFLRKTGSWVGQGRVGGPKPSTPTAVAGLRSTITRPRFVLL